METHARCALCSKELPPGAHFCPDCGAGVRDLRPRLATGLLPPQHTLNQRYLVLQKLAQGGQSAVYLAMDTLDGNQRYAIKEMSETDLSAEEHDKAINGFMREAKMLSNLKHPALATVYDIFVEDRKHYLVMEYVPGHNLEDEMMSAGRPLASADVVRWGIALCDVLAYLHSQQPPIIYRDLKPPNVMLTPDGAIKLIDFGIARWLHPARLRDTTQLGTDGYAPPEQYAARSEPRSDIYGLGASMYHLLTGRVPESAPLRMAGRPLTPIRVINGSVPEMVERVITQALALQPQDRFASAAHMRRALEWTQQSVQSQQPVGGHARVTAAPALVDATARVSAAPAANAGAAQQHAAAPPAIPPHLSVWPLRLDAGFIEVNKTAILALEISNRGGGKLVGRTETNLACLTIEPQTLEATTKTLQVKIDATNLPAGPYVCHLAVRTNGGDQIIPVRFVVHPPSAASGNPRVTQQ